MTDTIKLDQAIRRSLISKPILAKKLNISIQTLYNKLNNVREFKASEIVKICEILNLSKKDREQIFFTINVD